MNTVAEAVREAERDAEASQAAREGRPGATATATEQRNEETMRDTEATGRNDGLHEEIATATALEAPANATQRRRLQTGKAPAETIGTETPPAERRQQTTLATRRYERAVDPAARAQSPRQEASRAGPGGPGWR